MLGAGSAPGSPIFAVGIPLVTILLAVVAAVGLWRLLPWGAWAGVMWLFLAVIQRLWLAYGIRAEPVLQVVFWVSFADIGLHVLLGIYLWRMVVRGVLAH